MAPLADGVTTKTSIHVINARDISLSEVVGNRKRRAPKGPPPYTSCVAGLVNQFRGYYRFGRTWLKSRRRLIKRKPSNVRVSLDQLRREMTNVGH